MKASSIVEILGHRAQSQSEQIAYSYRSSGEREESITFGRLAARARAMAARLASDARPDDRVVIALPPGIGYIVAVYGCFLAGLVAVPLYPPRVPRQSATLAAVCADCDPAIVLVEEVAVAAAKVLQWRGSQHAIVLSMDDCNSAADESVGISPGRADLALLQYTSGSTGSPKGVMLTHGNLISNLEQQRLLYGIDELSRLVIWLPPYHDMGMGGGILQPMYSNMPVKLMAPVYVIQRPLRWLQAIHEMEATISGGPPFVFEACATRIKETDCEGLDLSRWKCAFVGAEPIPFHTLDRFAKAFRRCGFRSESFLPSYGLAEATLLVTASELQQGPKLHPATQAREQQRVNCGRVIAGHELLIVDPDRCVPCEDGTEGEIWLSGPSVAIGYWNNQKWTSATFQAYLADGRGPYLRTGDLGLLLEGDLAVTGRIKDVIIFAGRKLHAEDVEETVAAMGSAQFGVAGAAAFAAEIEGQERLIVAIALFRRRSQLAAAEEAELRERVSSEICSQHGVTAHDIYFVNSGDLPRTSSGKIRRHQSRADYLERHALPGRAYSVRHTA